MHMGNIIRENVIIVGRLYHGARECCRRWRLMLVRYLVLLVADAIGLSRVYLLKKTKENRKYRVQPRQSGVFTARWVPGAAPGAGAAARSDDVNRDSSFYFLLRQTMAGKCFLCVGTRRGVWGQ